MGIPAIATVGASGLPPTGDKANGVISGTFSAIGPGLPFAFRGPFNAVLYASINTTLTTTLAGSTGTVGSATGLAVGAAINGANIPKGTTIGVLNGTTVTFALPTQTIYAIGAASSQTLTGMATITGLLGATVTGPGVPASTTVIAYGADGASVLLSNALTSAPAVLQPQPFKFALTANSIVAGADTGAIFTGVGVTFSGTVQLERSFDGGATWVLDNTSVPGTTASFNAGTPVSMRITEPEASVLYRWNCIAYSSGTINYRMSENGGAAESLAPMF